MQKLKEFFRLLASYTRPFWVANISEVFERLAYYGTNSMLVLYLTRTVGLTDETAQRLNGVWGSLVYGLPVLAGVLADVLGYRRSLLLAYVLLTCGYGWLSQGGGLVPISGALLLVALGASLVKPSITGTVQKTCDVEQRAVGFSIYYTLVNVGGFLGPWIAGAIMTAAGGRVAFAVSAASAAVALIIVAVSYHPPASAAPTERKSVAAIGRDLWTVLSDWRLMSIFFFAGIFFMIFWTLYTTFPLFLTSRLGANEAMVGRLISIESFCVIVLTVIVGAITRHFAASRALLAALLLSAAAMAILGVATSIYLAAAGVVVLALGEIVYSAHFYRFLGELAPPDQVGMYMGFAFLPIALGYFGAGWVSGLVKSLAGGRFDLMWLGFAAIGVAAAVGMYVLTQLLHPKAPTAA
jgi:POT family proton-dependent oligopeptide transporter